MRLPGHAAETTYALLETSAVTSHLHAAAMYGCQRAKRRTWLGKADDHKDVVCRLAMAQPQAELRAMMLLLHMEQTLAMMLHSQDMASRPLATASLHTLLHRYGLFLL